MIKHYKNIHNYDVYTLDISKDNSKFITGGGDKNIILTDVVEGKYIRKYTGHTARVNSVCFNPDNNVIVTRPTRRSVPPMTPPSASGTTGMMPTIPSRSSRASRIQCPRCAPRTTR
jgi:WD40 repeat protein